MVEDGQTTRWGERVPSFSPAFLLAVILRVEEELKKS